MRNRTNTRWCWSRLCFLAALLAITGDVAAQVGEEKKSIRPEEISLSYLRPDQIRQRLAQAPVVFLPIGPLEWHGPHMPYGTDPLNAEEVAKASCRKIGGIVWPTLFWGTERERSTAELKSLGFKEGQYVVGMDFPANSLPSAYCPEEVFAILVREVLREAKLMGAKLVVIVNGHGATNHVAVLKRLEVEHNQTTGPKVYVRAANAAGLRLPGAGGHATTDETSRMMLLTASVDLSKLPPLPMPLKYPDYAIVDNPGFSGTGRPDFVLSEDADPRRTASVARGRQLIDATVEGVASEVKALLAEIR